MCALLKITTAGYYKHINRIACDRLALEMQYDSEITLIFKNSKKTYGCRRVKSALQDIGIKKSRKYIARAMKRLGLVSAYNKKSFKKPSSSGVNKDNEPNLIDRNFDCWKLNEVLTSDLTYMNVCGKHHYVCFIIDLATREIVGYSVADNKRQEMVMDAFKMIKFSLANVAIFHTDRGMEFKNEYIMNLLTDNNIKRSLSDPGTPYDNAVSESTFKTFKVSYPDTYVYGSIFELKRDVDEFVNWYNTFRKHSAIGNKSPIQERYNLQKIAA